MKLITAIIKPFKLDDVRESLLEIGIHGMTVTEVKGFGRSKEQAQLYQHAEYLVEFLPKLKIEIIVAENLLQPAIRAITEVANTNSPGDGKIMVSSLEQVIKIRTGEEVVT